MITIEHIRELDRKVSTAITIISSLRGENDALKGKLEDYEKRIQELEKLVDEFKEDQSEIEQGILNALSQLDKLEDDMSSSDHPATEAADSPVSSKPVESEADSVADETDKSEDESSDEDSSSELDIF